MIGFKVWLMYSISISFLPSFFSNLSMYISPLSSLVQFLSATILYII